MCDLDRIICDSDYQPDLVITDLEKDICMDCGKKYTHRKINWGNLDLQSKYEGLVEVEFILECAKCRHNRKKIKEIKDKIKKMEQEIIDLEFDTFSRKYNIVKNS